MMDEKPELGAALLVELTAEIVSAYIGNHAVPIVALPKLISDVHIALNGTASEPQLQAVAERPIPKVPVRQSIHDDHLICLEDGRKFKSLKRHLMSFYGMTPEHYRKKWDLPSDYPMAAPSYAAARSKLAKEISLGQRRKDRRTVTEEHGIPTTSLEDHRSRDPHSS